MSEVILETSNMIWQKSGKPIKEIVRCGDCTHFREVRMSDGTAKTVCSGVMAYVEPDPMGFCAWGERRES